MRNNWPVPQTVLMTSAECERQRPKQPTCCGPGRRKPKVSVSFSTWTTADAAMHLARKYGRGAGNICLLNFANGDPNHVGGGYKKGALAQEEDLCRRMPNLYTALLQAARDGHYPFGPSTYGGGNDTARYSDVLVTPDVALARSGEADGFEFLDPQQSSLATVVSAAAPNVAFGGEIAEPSLTLQAVRTIFVGPKVVQPSLKVLIVGAWGCGAFGGDPVHMSDLFITAMTIEGLGNLYEEVHFAIPAGGHDQHADIFRSALKKAGLRLEELSK